MSVNLKSGDLLRDKSEAITNTVNCVGIMGRGIALQFKQRWPQNFKVYADACRHKLIKPGKVFFAPCFENITYHYWYTANGRYETQNST